jgi:signal transduction histidine kinase
MPVPSFSRWSELLPEPMLLLSAPDGRIVAANRSVDKLDLDAAALPGCLLADLVVEEADHVAAYLRQCARSRQLMPGSLTIRGADGAATPCRGEGAVFEPRTAAAPALLILRLLRKQDSVYRFLALTERIEALNREMTRRREAEEEVKCQREALHVTVQRLAEADQRKDEFLAMLSHELRNPLAPIRNALSILGAPDAPADALRDAREMMSRQIRHLVRLVDDLLDISRITQGKIHLQKERVDLAALAARTADSLRPLADAKGVALALRLPGEPVFLDADPVRLEQVLFNLLHNGVKFTPAGGQLWLEVAAAAGEASLRVRDTGVGIAADLLPQIFEPFVQADRSIDRSQGGLGLGLTLVRSLSELHGGSVAVTSAGDGRGSEFTVRLPLPGQPAAGAAPVPSSEPRQQQPRRVLVVDDNEDAAQSIAILLGLWGYEATTAYDGNAALAAAADFDPDLVLLDLGLPGLDGCEVARRLRAGGWRGLLVALTGYGRDEDRARAREAGFDRHLLKPVDPDALRRLLLDWSPSKP